VPVITSHYAALLALLLLALSIQVIRARVAARVGLGLGEGEEGHRRLLRASRAQGNFTEYAPMVLALMLLLELSAAPGWLLHALGSMLLAGRLAHALGISKEPEVLRLRQLGMALTFTALAGGAAALWVW
jgi:uncharacterized membrane protein YecN with MAPEG domain